jgi:hypothetical protein
MPKREPPDPVAALEAVAGAARARIASQEAFEASLRAAVDAGATLRAIAGAAGVTHGRVSQIVGPVGKKGGRRRIEP